MTHPRHANRSITSQTIIHELRLVGYHFISVIGYQYASSRSQTQLSQRVIDLIEPPLQDADLHRRLIVLVLMLVLISVFVVVVVVVEHYLGL